MLCSAVKGYLFSACWSIPLISTNIFFTGTRISLSEGAMMAKVNTVGRVVTLMLAKVAWEDNDFAQHKIARRD